MNVTALKSCSMMTVLYGDVGGTSSQLQSSVR